MSTKKMNKLEWAQYIELKRRNLNLKEKLKKSRKLNKEKDKEVKKFNAQSFFRKYLYQSWIVGVIAALILGLVFSWRLLLEHILSWTIGVTVITTFFAAFSRKESNK